MDRDTLKKLVNSADEANHRAYLQGLSVIPLGVAHICADCSAIHAHQFCPNCGSTNFEMVEKMLPKSSTTWRQELEFNVRARKRSLVGQNLGVRR